MRRAAVVLLGTLGLFALAGGCSPARGADEAGCKDHPLFNRMPAYEIQRCEEKEFDALTIHSDTAPQEFQAEGHLYFIRYVVKEGATQASRLQILRNYENAAKKFGGKVLKSDWDGISYLHLTRDGKEFWVEVSVGLPSEWNLTIVEKQAMAQDIEASAAAFAGDIRTTGHAAVYGIYFDTGKSVLKPESDVALAEIAKLLTADPALQLNVVGHTDNVGLMDANLKLSQARAAAVVAALTAKHGIAAARLKPFGVSSLAPVASNSAEEGRARNRRVELVQQ
jgi:OmpA-OmpF porin, OOP family